MARDRDPTLRNGGRCSGLSLVDNRLCVNRLCVSYLSLNSIEPAEARCPWRKISRVLGRGPDCSIPLNLASLRQITPGDSNVGSTPRSSPFLEVPTSSSVWTAFPSIWGTRVTGKCVGVSSGLVTKFDNQSLFAAQDYFRFA